MPKCSRRSRARRAASKDEPVARLFDALVAPLIAHQSQCLTVALGAQGLAGLGVRAVDDVVLRLQDRLAGYIDAVSTSRLFGVCWRIVSAATKRAHFR